MFFNYFEAQKSVLNKM